MIAKLKTRLVLTILLIFSINGCTCSRSDDSKNASSGTAQAAKSLNLFIWGEYVSKGVLAAFEQKTGIHVNETNFSSPEEALAKIQAGAAGYDLIVPSDYMVAIMIKLGMLEKLDRTKIPHAAQIEPSLLGKEFDPTNEFSLPYSWSTTGIAVMTSKSPVKITGYKQMLTEPKLKNRISMLDDMREEFSVALRMQGDNVNTTNEEKLKQAAVTLAGFKQHIKEFNSTPAQSLIQGDVVAAQMYSNEALRAEQTHPDIDFIIPEEGTTFAIDCMVILKTSQKKNEAHALIDFFLEPENNQKFVEELVAAPVIKGVAEKLPPKLRDNPIITKPGEIEKKTESLRDVGDATTIYDRLWTEIKARQ